MTDLAISSFDSMLMARAAAGLRRYANVAVLTCPQPHPHPRLAMTRVLQPVMRLCWIMMKPQAR
jgi:hypothetical protein